MKPHWKIVAGVIATGLLIWGAWFGVVLYNHEENLRMRALTPNIAFDFTRQEPGSPTFCFDLGFIGQDKAPAPLRWEQFYVHEYRPEGPRDYPVPGMSGDLTIGDRTCGFIEDGWYDFVYKPTSRASYYKYPGCGGDPDGNIAEEFCPIPSDWPR